MITAAEARKKTIYNASHNRDVANLLHIIGIRIEEACQSSHDRLTFSVDETKYIRCLPLVANELITLGYKVEHVCHSFRNETQGILNISW